MSELLTQVLEGEIAQMRKSLAIMAARGATEESVNRRRAFIAELQTALARHEAPNA